MKSIRETIINLAGTTGMLEAIEKNFPAIKELARSNIQTCHDAQDILRNRMWRPAEKSPPKEDGSYIGYVLCEGEKHIGQVFYLEGKWSTYINAPIQVTHWMPMPEPPEEE